MKNEDLNELPKRGEEIIKHVADYIAEFAKDFEKIEVSQILKL